MKGLEAGRGKPETQNRKVQRTTNLCSTDDCHAPKALQNKCYLTAPDVEDSAINRDERVSDKRGIEKRRMSIEQRQIFNYGS
ncbi:MAG: hypothetical protein EA361_04995 [Bacteroidetes bacterium]|nr:MAG: hypothetical protein EA361_04995 [Bacteroidota bacterium]